MKEILIKVMTNENLNDIVELEKMSFSDPWTLKMFEEELKHPNIHYFVAVYNDEIIGYTGFWHIVDEGHITNICVHKEFQQKGIATGLMSYVLDFMVELGINTTTLEVRESNNAAIKFYEKIGFKNEGVRKNYYKNPQENAIIMWRKTGG